MRVGIVVLIGLALCAPDALGQPYPDRPIRLISPNPAGGANDTIVRIMAARMSTILGASFVIDNRGGAGGKIGAEAVARAAPDGYTLLAASVSTHSFAPVVTPKLGYDPIKDFEPISLLALVQNVLVVNPSLPVANISELIALARSQPGKLNYASGGPGSTSHFAVAMFVALAGIQHDTVHVPYKGGGPAMQDVIAGHVKIMFSSLVQTTPFIKSGQLIALGTGGAKRSPVLPDVPTIAEAGVPGYVADNWWGLAAPAGLPQPLADKLYAASQEALKSPELQAAFDREGAATVEMTPDQFAEYIKTEIAKWGRVVKEGNIHAQ